MTELTEKQTANEETINNVETKTELSVSTPSTSKITFFILFHLVIKMSCPDGRRFFYCL